MTGYISQVTFKICLYLFYIVWLYCEIEESELLDRQHNNLLLINKAKMLQNNVRQYICNAYLMKLLNTTSILFYKQS